MMCATQKTYKKGTAETSGGRWGVPKAHAVRPDTERKVGQWGTRATALCGADVFPFDLDFDPASEGTCACKRCLRAIDAAQHEEVRS